MGKGISAKVYGRVQGVNFRAWTKQNASSLGLGGWVQNDPDGNLSLEAFGEEEKIDKFKKLLHKGAPMSFVEKVEVQEIPFQSTSVFKIKYS